MLASANRKKAPWFSFAIPGVLLVLLVRSAGKDGLLAIAQPCMQPSGTPRRRLQRYCGIAASPRLTFLAFPVIKEHRNVSELLISSVCVCV